MKNLFKDTFGRYRQTYLDLPGFGNSSSGDLVLTSQDYAYIVKIFLRAVGLKPTAIIGHSFGGKGCHTSKSRYIGFSLSNRPWGIKGLRKSPSLAWLKGALKNLPNLNLKFFLKNSGIKGSLIPRN